METRAAVAPSEEERQVRELAHEFAAGELRPHVEVWDRERAIRAAVVGQLAELGFLEMAIPEEHGGMGFDAATFAAAVEERAWGEASVAMLVVRHAAAADLILRLGTEEQRARWLPAMARGETLAALAHWDTDDDAPATLEREGDALVLRGELARGTRARSTGLIAARGPGPGGGAAAARGGDRRARGRAPRPGGGAGGCGCGAGRGGHRAAGRGGGGGRRSAGGARARGRLCGRTPAVPQTDPRVRGNAVQARGHGD